MAILNLAKYLISNDLTIIFPDLLQVVACL